MLDKFAADLSQYLQAPHCPIDRKRLIRAQEWFTWQPDFPHCEVLSSLESILPTSNKSHDHAHSGVFGLQIIGDSLAQIIKSEEILHFVC